MFLTKLQQNAIPEPVLSHLIRQTQQPVDEAMSVSEQAASLYQQGFKDLFDSVNTDTFYILHVSNIDYDLDDGFEEDEAEPLALPKMLTFTFQTPSDDLSFDDVAADVEDLISDETGFMFKSCDLMVVRFNEKSGLTDLTDSDAEHDVSEEV